MINVVPSFSRSKSKLSLLLFSCLFLVSQSNDVYSLSTLKVSLQGLSLACLKAINTIPNLTMLRV
uniref:Uncharacterized protein n=1 Tax=Picea glauca TaxID=3330 RepID=A0A101LY96_PICGL|nr:hypothetical protein ABT39_MTgene5767 [Picea glauca]QHR90460.1 hypothetical protein Q903MT_gene4484 [Picea sitchensis]